MTSTTTPKKTVPAGDSGIVVFRELKDVSLSDGHRPKDSELWTTEHVQHTDLGRLHLRALEAILSPTTSSADIISAVAFGVTSQGLRVTHRDDAQGRIVAQRIEAPYLASFSGRNTRSAAGTEWRVVVATLSVSKGVAAWGGVERVLLLEFMTDPCPKQDLAGRSAAAVASFAERLRAGSVAAGLSSGTSGRDSASGGTSGRTPSSLSAVAIAHQRSNQRADALVEGVVTELRRLDCAAVDGSVAGDGGLISGVARTKVSGAPAVDPTEGGNGGDGEDTTTTTTATTTMGNNETGVAEEEEEFVLAPFEGGGEVMAKIAASRAPAVDRSVGDGVDASSQDDSPHHKEGGAAKALGGGPMVTGEGGARSTCEVHLCLQFVERLCARAEEYSRRDALETWRPLEGTVRRLERDNEMLHQLLEPKYRILGAVPPPVPTWSGHTGYSGSSSLMGTKAGNQNRAGAGTDGSGRVVALLQSNPLFVVERAFVKARVVVPRGSGTSHEQGGVASKHAPASTGTSTAADTVSAAGGSSASENASPSAALPGSIHSVVTASAAGGTGNERDPTDGRTATDARLHWLLARAVVKALAAAVGEVCEDREEDFLKHRIPGAQVYVAELEAYRSELVGGKPIRAVASFPDGKEEEAGEEEGGSSIDIDDDLWRIFGAMETRLYSSPAALGKKPGRIYLTFGTLWFHSKVLGFEARLVLPLAEVKSVVLLGTALDLSASLVVSTKVGEEIMFVFPGQRTATLEPVELLIRQLASLAAERGQGGYS